VDVEGDYLTDVLTDAAVDFIDTKASGDRPFMLYMAYNAPHGPLQATEKYLNRFSQIKNKKRRTYAAMISAMDDGVGRIMESVRRHGMEENTIVVFLSDNGGVQNNSCDNGPLRAWKGSLFEGGIRVPFAMQWKGTIPAGQVYEHPVISLDIMATISALADADVSKEKPLDGVNLIPHLTGENPDAPHDRLFWRSYHKDGICVREGSMKLVADRDRNQGYALYDLSADIGEQNDLLSQHPEKGKIFEAACDEWNKELKPTLFPTLGEDKWWAR